MLCFASAASASGYSDGGRDLSRGTAKSSRRVCIRLASRPAAHESRHRPACHVERVVNDCDIVRPRRLGDRSRRLSTGRRVEEPTVHPCSNRASHACNARGTSRCASQLFHSKDIASYFTGRTDCMSGGRGGGGKPCVMRQKVPKLPPGGMLGCINLVNVNGIAAFASDGPLPLAVDCVDMPRPLSWPSGRTRFAPCLSAAVLASLRLCDSIFPPLAREGVNFKRVEKG